MLQKEPKNPKVEKGALEVKASKRSLEAKSSKRFNKS